MYMYKMSGDEHEQTSPVSEESSLNAVVKWFNNRAGYGFLTVSEGERKDTDIFVHHSALQVSEDQYKYLVAGEYVTFDLSTTSNDHEFQATQVRGVNGGRLMCETRRNARNEQETDEDGGQRRNARVRGPGPREGSRRPRISAGEPAPAGYQWVLVPAGAPAPGRGRGRPPQGM
jgi:CspA family cold shock protein